MDFERFEEFMLQSAARHEERMAAFAAEQQAFAAQQRVLAAQHQALAQQVTELAAIQKADHLENRRNGRLLHKSITLLATTVDHLVDNQAGLQQSQKDLRASLDELRGIVFRHVTDPNGHKVQ